ncbi:MAG TPA: TrmH family RNA methyltransferase [Candidatus Kaiserbacteria bacterium]|nr:TrmH family RNA methyltransferase [Candidatus Kaiserbacteria bacterium]
MTEIKVILHNIRSSLNVGSVFRTADGAGVKQIYLTGHTPTPIDRFGRNEATIAKTALGAENSILWEKGDIIQVIDLLKSNDYRIIGVEQTPSSKNYKTFIPKKRVVFIFGNEVDGVEKEVLEQCDEVIEIPMHGEKESLNVAVTAGIILFNF